MFQNSGQVTEKIKKKIKTNDKKKKKKTTRQLKTYGMQKKAVLRRKFTATKSYLKKQDTPVRMAIVKTSTNNKCWRGYGEKGMLWYC